MTPAERAAKAMANPSPSATYDALLEAYTAIEKANDVIVLVRDQMGGEEFEAALAAYDAVMWRDGACLGVPSVLDRVRP